MKRGSKHSKESRKKLSLSHKGKSMLPQTRLAILKANTGRKCTDKTKRKIGLANSVALKGYKHSENARQNMSLAKKGKIPKNIDSIKGWNKGLGSKTSKVLILRNSLDYRKWRKAVFIRDNFTCVLCNYKSKGTRPSDIHADHIRQFSVYPELMFDVSNGRTLCIPCHRNTDTWGGRSRETYDIRYNHVQ